MEIAEVYEIFSKNINKVLNPSSYKNIIRKDNNLGRFDVLNRILLSIQNINAYDVRTADEWLLDNRVIKKGSKPCYILVPLYKHEYIDSDSGKPVNTGDLTLDETNAAIKYGLIQREDKIETSYTKSVFDIRQTKPNKANEKYKITKPVIKTSKIIGLVRDITGCTVEKSDMTYYSKSNNTFYISKQEYKQLCMNVVDVIVDYCIDNLVNAIPNNSEIEFSEYDIELIRNTLTFSLDTFLRDGRDSNFDIVMHTSTEKVLTILNITDSIVFNITSSLEYNNQIMTRDISYNIDMLKKAEALLDIMEANNVNKKMKGM